MSLYEDEELGPPSAEVAVGWAKGVKLMQSHIQLKKASAKTITESHSGLLPGVKTKFAAPILAPVIDLKSKQKAPDEPKVINKLIPSSLPPRPKTEKSFRGSGFTVGDKSLIPLTDGNVTISNEYDPLWPNDYFKVVQEMRDKKHGGEDPLESRKRRYTEAGRERARERFNNDGRGETRQSEYSGLGMETTATSMRRRNEEEDDDDPIERRRGRRSAGSSGAAIAPPPSLTETTPATPPPVSQSRPLGPPGGGSLAGLGIAAKIMAKYGYKQGQGLGRSEQGMSVALAVEKTSKRGGRIVHEKEFMPPPPMFGQSFKMPNTPPDLTGDPGSPSPDDIDSGVAATDTAEAKPSITDLLKNPSKVVMCKNMVGPGEVDDDLEPEVKEECNNKYGDVLSVAIVELPNMPPEETVRIFIEFSRVESAIKAVVDLNGRFFGGREVRACFFDVFKFKNRQLRD